jgi:hypothetical protein
MREVVDIPELVWQPPADVRRRLRQEVGFGCPLPRCRSAFLEYHHFDPEWHVEHHHRPEGIIPLCPTHHAQAGAFTVDQFREFKVIAQRTSPAAGRFEWMRRDLVGAVGGCLYHETPVLVQLGSEPMIWFERDEFGHALLNSRMLTTHGKDELRMRVQNNDFIVRGDPADFECPPSGRLLRIRYPDGDYMRIEFREVQTWQTASKRFRHMKPDYIAGLDGSWPKTFVLVSMSAGGTSVRFGPTMTMLPRNNTIRGGVISHCAVGLVF